MNFYHSALILLASGCGLLTWRQYRGRGSSPEKQPLNAPLITPSAKAEVTQFQWLFLIVYVLTMGADWLQGPYIYSLYKDQFGLKERIVAALFTTGFLSGGISGYFVGQFADKFGRKIACLVFCIAYSLSCFSTLLPKLPILFLGRVLGGISTSLMFSAFESWMVSEYHKRKLDKAGMSLSSMFGVMTTLNSIAAILAGVFSEWLVQVTDSKRSPFMASATLLTIAFWTILLSWTENYGDSHEEAKSSTSSAPVPAKNALVTIFTDKRILTLGLASTFFDGSMYLFVYFWVATLVAAQTLAGSPSLPLGLIFSCFMCSVMLGSLVFNLVVSKYRLISHSRLLTILFATSSGSLLIPVFIKDETITFWSFCVFELCVGMYWPSVGYLKGRLIDDGIRARVYGMMRIPLNVFVVVALSLIKEGPEYRNLVFLICSGLLIFTSGMFHYFVGE